MSKKKSAAWDRKAKGYITKWTYNYASLTKMGQNSFSGTRRKTRRKRVIERIIELAEHEARTQREAHIDLNLVAGIMELTDLGLTDAKTLAVTLQQQQQQGDELWQIT